MTTPNRLRCALWILCIPFFPAASRAQAIYKQSPAELYAGIRVAAKQMVSSPEAQHFYQMAWPEPNRYDLKLCFDASDWGVPAESPLLLATTIALDLEFYQMLLHRLEVPPAVTQKSFAAMEAMAIASLQERPPPGGKTGKDSDGGAAAFEDAQQRLARQLNDYGGTRRPVMEFFYMGECGAGFAEVKINVTPPGGTVRYIPLFPYKLCEAKKVNPEDTKLCEGWQTAVKVTEDMVGKYHYIATWPDGKQSKGIFEIHGETAINITPQ